MSDENVEQQNAEAPQESQKPETDWKAEARKWEARAKENKLAADRLAEFEEAQKSEQQKLVERAERAENDLKAARREAERMSVLAKHGIPENLQHLVQGDTADQLNMAAESVAGLLTETQQVKGRVVLENEGSHVIPLNGSGIEESLRRALNIN